MMVIRGDLKEALHVFEGVRLHRNYAKRVLTELRGLSQLL